jgi:hypothetical protein
MQAPTLQKAPRFEDLSPHDQTRIALDVSIKVITRFLPDLIEDGYCHYQIDRLADMIAVMPRGELSPYVSKIQNSILETRARAAEQVEQEQEQAGG